jgi:hypothetical protein
MMFKKARQLWDKYTDGPIGNVVYLILGFAIAYSFNLIMGMALNTTTPVVAVYSCSMEHNTYNNWWQNCNLAPTEVCGKNVGDLDTMNFDDYWKLCGSWYESNGISKDQFKDFPFNSGLEVGDMIVVMNTGTVNTGDIIIFSSDIRKFPIIHRVVNASSLETKGDNNGAPDSIGQKKVLGKAVFRVPMLGWVKILFTQITGIP